MQSLTLNDGTVLDNSYAAITTDRLFLYINNGMNIIQIVMLLCDPEKTWRIVYSSGDGNSVEYSGFTVLVSVQAGVNGLISGALKR